MRSIPEQSPIDGGALICGGCGKDMTRTVTMGRKGVQSVRFECINEETGCRYFIERKTFVQAEMKGIRQDGTTVVVPESRT